LRPADDAFQIDTSDLDIEAAVAAALTFITSQRT
jgi:cytidylate kinase